MLCVQRHFLGEPKLAASNVAFGPEEKVTSAVREHLMDSLEDIFDIVDHFQGKAAREHDDVDPPVIHFRKTACISRGSGGEVCAARWWPLVVPGRQSSKVSCVKSWLSPQTLGTVVW